METTNRLIPFASAARHRPERADGCVDDSEAELELPRPRVSCIRGCLPHPQCRQERRLSRLSGVWILYHCSIASVTHQTGDRMAEGGLGGGTWDVGRRNSNYSGRECLPLWGGRFAGVVGGATGECARGAWSGAGRALYACRRAQEHQARRRLHIGISAGADVGHTGAECTVPTARAEDSDVPGCARAGGGEGGIWCFTALNRSAGLPAYAVFPQPVEPRLRDQAHERRGA